MSKVNIHCFLVQPGKHLTEQPTIKGSVVPDNHPAYKMLSGVFDKAPSECNIEMVFQPNEIGEQNNEVRSMLVAYAKVPNTRNGKKLALRLQTVTTHVPGLGLLFLMTTKEKQSARLVLSRFPATQGVVAHEREGKLAVEFLDRVFLRNATAYKCAYYMTDSLNAGFSEGTAVDKQSNSDVEISQYWIGEFLLSELRTTGAAGSRRFAEALKNAINSTTSLEVRQQLISVASLARAQHGKRVSVSGMVMKMGIADSAMNALRSSFARPELLNETFDFDHSEFDRHVPYRAVALDNGALMIAEDAKFDMVFPHAPSSDAKDAVRYVTEGRIVDERLRKQK